MCIVPLGQIRALVQYCKSSNYRIMSFTVRGQVVCAWPSIDVQQLTETVTNMRLLTYVGNCHW